MNIPSIKKKKKLVHLWSANFMALYVKSHLCAHQSEGCVYTHIHMWISWIGSQQLFLLREWQGKKKNERQTSLF